MGRNPIHDEPMTAAERQRRRRRRLRECPWICARPMMDAVATAIRRMQDDQVPPSVRLAPEQVEHLVELAMDHLAATHGCGADMKGKGAGFLAKLLDPTDPGGASTAFAGEPGRRRCRERSHAERELCREPGEPGEGRRRRRRRRAHGESGAHEA